MTETEFTNCIAYGPRSNPKKAIILNHPDGLSSSYVLAGEIFRVEKITNTENYGRKEQCKVYPIGGQSFLVKESAEEVLRLLGWTVE